MAAFKVKTWNVENLFPAGTASGPPTQAEYSAKIAGHAATIEPQAPDLIALQEIGDPFVLDDLTQAIGRTSHQHVSTHPDVRGIRVPRLTKHQITASRDIIDLLPGLLPVQIDDDDGSISRTGRGGAAVSVDLGGEHILVSTALVDRVTSAQAVILDPLPSITPDPNAQRSAPSSDHPPVVAAFGP